MSDEQKDDIVEDVIDETLDGVVEEVTEETVVENVESNSNNYKQQAQENLEKYQRCMAEFDNFRKRTVKEKASMYDDGIRNTVEKILLVADNLERAIATQKDADEEDSFFKGVKMTLKQFQDVMESLGVETIPSVGETFDPELHSAVAHEDNSEFGENEIMIEMLKGYKYKDKVIRHSMVKVAN